MNAYNEGTIAKVLNTLHKKIWKSHEEYYGLPFTICVNLLQYKNIYIGCHMVSFDNSML